jgi:hypothetical protein
MSAGAYAICQVTTRIDARDLDHKTLVLHCKINFGAPDLKGAPAVETLLR